MMCQVQTCSRFVSGARRDSGVCRSLRKDVPGFASTIARNAKMLRGLSACPEWLEEEP